MIFGFLEPLGALIPEFGYTKLLSRKYKKTRSRFQSNYVKLKLSQRDLFESDAFL